MHARSVLGWCCVAFAATAMACTGGGEKEGAGNDGGSGGGGGTGGDAIPSGPPTVTETEQLGGYTPGPVRAVLAGAQRGLDVIGHAGVEIDPEVYGLDLPAGEAGTAIFGGGFSVLDRATGKVRFYDADDGVPEVNYVDGPITYGVATAPVFAMTWVVPDEVFAAAAWDWVIVGTIAADGSVSFASTQLRAEGEGVDAFVATVASAGGELYAGTSQGLAVLDPSTLAVDRWAHVGPALASAPFIYDLAAGDLDGPAVLAVVGTYEQPTHLALVGPGGTTVQFLEEGEIPTSVGAIPGALLAGVRRIDGRGWVGAFRPGLGGPAFEPFLSADQLRTVENPNVIPARFAYDAGRGLLLVGGSFVDDSPSQPIALVAADLAVDPPAVRDLVDRRAPYYWAMPWNVDALAVDGAGSWYVAGRELCSHVHAKQLGLYRYEFAADGALRIVRPWVSGVRAVAVDPVAGHTWLGLGDATGSLACFGQSVQSGICRLKADGSCELWTPSTNAPGDDRYVSLPAPTGLAFGDPAKKQVAVLARGAGLFVRVDDTTRAMNPTQDPGTSLWTTGVAWGEGGELWIGSISQWTEMPGFTPEELDAIDTRTPHGLGFLRLGETAYPERDSIRRYSRLQAVNWNKDYDTPGMPSNTAYDVMALPGSQHALAACGIERIDRVADHLLPEPSPKGISGGIAEIAGTEVHTFSPPEGLAFGDVVALARDGKGRYFALDAALGIVALDLETRTTTLHAKAPWTAPERGLSLAADDSGRLAAGTTRGLYVFGPSGDAATVSAAGLGFVWEVAFVADGVLYAGADQGLVRVALDGAALPPKGPAGALPREPWELPPGCNGEEGCSCGDDIQCAPGLSCLCDEQMDCACGVYDPCLANPGALGCACKQPAIVSPCQEGLACLCEGETCTCQEDPAGCGGVEGCACEVDTDCAGGLVCHESGVCVDPAFCADDCSCDTESGCPEGKTCQTWVDPEGVERAYCDFPPECREDCSCLSPSGCPDGYYCMERTDGTKFCRPGI